MDVITDGIKEMRDRKRLAVGTASIAGHVSGTTTSFVQQESSTSRYTDRRLQNLNKYRRQNDDERA